MEHEVINALVGIAGGLLSLLVIVVGWIGSRIHSRLDSISKSLQAIERDLRSDLSGLDRRVVRLEVIQGISRD